MSKKRGVRRLRPEASATRGYPVTRSLQANSFRGEPLESRLLFAASSYYTIHLVDSATGRGVPQTDLVMTDGTRYTSDSGGTVAFNRSGYIGIADTFVVESYGYALPTGSSFTVTPTLGGSTTVALSRSEISQRMYRETGENIYSQTVATGGTSPITTSNANPNLSNASVYGQDSGLTTIYKGKLYEFWGDTGYDTNDDGNQDGGNYHTTGGTINLPANGGLDPSVGENITYFTNAGSNTPKQMFPTSSFGYGGNLIWASSPMDTYDSSGNERMVISYYVTNGGSALERGFGVWNDTTQQFDKVSSYSTSLPIYPGQDATLTSFNGVNYYVIPNGNSFIRVQDDYADITNINSYQVYTPLKPGTIVSTDNFLGLTHNLTQSMINYDSNNKVVWTWSANTTPLFGIDYQNITNNGWVPAAQNPFLFKDTAGSGTVPFSTSALSYNNYLKEWTLIGQQEFGSSILGEMWYAEAPSITGPWSQTTKIQTDTRANGVNDTYTFYNLIQHPEFDENSQYLYYSGTYTSFLTTGGLTGQYFSNSNLTGYVFKQNDSPIDFSYGSSSSNKLITNTDNFSVKWTGNIAFDNTGSYQFRVTSDAGAKLVVNGKTLVNALTATAQASYTGSITASSGQSSKIELDYESLTSTSANIKLEWLEPGSTTWVDVPTSQLSHSEAQPIDNYNTVMYRIDLTDARLNGMTPGAGLTTQYFSDNTLANYSATSSNQIINGSWTAGTSPVAGAPANRYSARYTGLIQPLYSQNYTFYLTSDGSAKLYINGQLLVYNWTDHSTQTDSASITLQAYKRYDIRVEYAYNGTGNGQVKLEWSSASQARQVVPAGALYATPSGLLATYFNDQNLTTAAVTENTPTVNFAEPAVSALSPDSASVTNDGIWSTRYTGQVRPDFSGVYTFSTSSDDGERLWVNGILLVNDWNNQGATTKSGTITLQAGRLYDIVFEYYNDLGNAVASLSWANAQQTSGVSTIIPETSLFATSTLLGGTNTVAGAVQAEKIFYNNSGFDGNSTAATPADDGAIATDKSALLPGQTATFANYTSYSKGINGIMIDVANLPANTALSAADFTFKAGRTTTPATWAAAPTPATITIRPGAGINGDYRIELIWADNAIQNEWLQVTLAADSNTALAAATVFYFGNAIGETGDSTTNAIVNAADAIGANNHPAGPFNPALISNVYDFNRDKLVNASDALIANNNYTSPFTALPLLAAPAAASGNSVKTGKTATAAVQITSNSIVTNVVSLPAVSNTALPNTSWLDDSFFSKKAKKH